MKILGLVVFFELSSTFANEQKIQYEPENVNSKVELSEVLFGTDNVTHNKHVIQKRAQVFKGNEIGRTSTLSYSTSHRAELFESVLKSAKPHLPMKKVKRATQTKLEKHPQNFEQSGKNETTTMDYEVSHRLELLYNMLRSERPSLFLSGLDRENNRNQPPGQEFNKQLTIKKQPSIGTKNSSATSTKGKLVKRIRYVRKDGTDAKIKPKIIISEKVEKERKSLVQEMRREKFKRDSLLRNESLTREIERYFAEMDEGVSVPPNTKSLQEYMALPKKKIERTDFQQYENHFRENDWYMSQFMNAMNWDWTSINRWVDRHGAKALLGFLHGYHAFYCRYNLIKIKDTAGQLVYEADLLTNREQVDRLNLLKKDSLRHKAHCHIAGYFNTRSHYYPFNPWNRFDSWHHGNVPEHIKQLG